MKHNTSPWNKWLHVPWFAAYKSMKTHDLFQQAIKFPKIATESPLSGAQMSCPTAGLQGLYKHSKPIDAKSCGLYETNGISALIPNALFEIQWLRKIVGLLFLHTYIYIYTNISLWIKCLFFFVRPSALNNPKRWRTEICNLQKYSEPWFTCSFGSRHRHRMRRPGRVSESSAHPLCTCAVRDHPSWQILSSLVRLRGESDVNCHLQDGLWGLMPDYKGRGPRLGSCKRMQNYGSEYFW